jgi:hypothetical protein
MAAQLPAPRGSELMGARIINRIIMTIQVISWAAITVVMGLLATIIAASIYGSLRLPN